MLQPAQLHMLAPAAALACWSLFMLLWMARSRFAAFANAGLDLSKAKPGARGSELEGRLPDSIMWKSHNYTHLMEQPTLFYAVVVILALAGPAEADITLAWGYTAIRIVHSLWQAIVNRLPMRLALFSVATLMLIALAIRALIITLNA